MPPTENGTSSNGTIFSGLPWWVRSLAVVGFPVMAAAYLTWLVGQALPSKLEAVQLKANEIYTLEYQHNTTFLQNWSKQDDTNAELISIARATCVNAAKDETARNRCLGR
jgi:hypothetical protein